MLRIVSGCTTREAFVSAFGRYCNGQAILVATRHPKASGEELSFTITLAGGEPLIAATGRVESSYTNGEGPLGRAGMLIRFVEVSPASRALVAELAAQPAEQDDLARGREPRDAADLADMTETTESSPGLPEDGSEGETRPTGLPRALAGRLSSPVVFDTLHGVAPARRISTPPPDFLVPRPGTIRPEDEGPTGVKLGGGHVPSRIPRPDAENRNEFEDEASWEDPGRESFDPSMDEGKTTLRVDMSSRFASSLARLVESSSRARLVECSVYEEKGLCDERGLPTIATWTSLREREDDAWGDDPTLPPWLRGPVPDIETSVGAADMDGLGEIPDAVELQLQEPTPPPFHSSFLPLSQAPSISPSSLLSASTPGSFERGTSFAAAAAPSAASGPGAAIDQRLPIAPAASGPGGAIDLRPPTAPGAPSGPAVATGRRRPTTPSIASGPAVTGGRRQEDRRARARVRPRSRWPLAIGAGTAGALVGLVIGYAIGLNGHFAVPGGEGADGSRRHASASLPRQTSPSQAPAAGGERSEAAGQTKPEDEHARKHEAGTDAVDHGEGKDDGASGREGGATPRRAAESGPPLRGARPEVALGTDPRSERWALAADNCGIEVESDPVESDVSVDGQILATTPARLVLPCGTHEIEVGHSRYETAQRRVRLRPGQLDRIEVPLERPDFKLRIVSAPLGASVVVNGRPVGFTPLVTQVKGYQHSKVRIERPGFEIWVRRVYARDPLTKLSVRLTPDRTLYPGGRLQIEDPTPGPLPGATPLLVPPSSPTPNGSAGR